MAAVAAAAGLLLSAGCQASSSSEEPTGAVEAEPVAEPTAPAASIDISPADDTTGVLPGTPVTVSAADGKLTRVLVFDRKGKELAGELGAERTTWTSTGRLRLANSYQVSASAVDANGLTVDALSSFRTTKPKKELVTSISPLSGSTVGIGMPIVVRFNEDVSDRAAVQRALTVTTSRPVEGAWSWTADDEVHYRPRSYWPANTDVSLDVGLRGVHAGKGLWGLESRTIDFTVGHSMRTVVNVKKHHATIYRDGTKARTVPVSTGKAGYLTRGGTKVVLEKHQLKVMDAATIGISPGDPEYYRLDVRYALRVTWSGEFVHAAPWSRDSQGSTNVSHGCVGMSTANAIWLYNRTNVGDVVEVKGSPRELEPGNGYTDWNVSWADWLKGSAV